MGKRKVNVRSRIPKPSSGALVYEVAKLRRRSAHGERGGKLRGSAGARVVARTLPPDRRRDERPRRAHVVGPGPPEHLLEHLYRLSGARCGLHHLAGTQGKEPYGGPSCAQVRL